MISTQARARPQAPKIHAAMSHGSGQGATRAAGQKGPVDLFEHRAPSATRWAGRTELKTLSQLGITAINLKADLTNIQYQDGSGISGQATFTRTLNGVTTTGTVANTTLMTESTGYAITNTSTVDASATRTTINTAVDSDGSIAANDNGKTFRQVAA